MLFIIYYSLFTIYYCLFVIYYLLFFTCYLVFVIFNYYFSFIYLFIHSLLLLLSFCFPNKVCISHSSFKSKAARIQALRISGSEFRRTDIRCEVVSMHEYVMQASCCRAEVPIKGWCAAEGTSKEAALNVIYFKCLDILDFACFLQLTFKRKVRFCEGKRCKSNFMAFTTWWVVQL